VASNGSKPLIGLTTYLEPTRFGVWETDAAVLHGVYVDGIVRAGGIPVLLPPAGDGYAELVSAVDGLVLTGGADIEPMRYGQEPHDRTYTRPARDTFEFALLDTALAAGLPVLGVCRGMQVLNVAFGGALTQHLPDATGNAEHQPAVATFATTTVGLAEGSLASQILGAETKCHCYHHQAIDQLGRGLQAVGWSQDGLIEAVELPGDAFVLGVQWHPEQDGDDQRLFAALVAAAADHRKKGRS
jgi:putative glutamine amidotransferase